MMIVEELIRVLEQQDKRMRVVLASDEEGNAFYEVEDYGVEDSQDILNESEEYSQDVLVLWP
jgi:hypothetical protein